MKAEFEEKDYEAPLYSELRFGSHRIATPGQVFEGKFGIDAALEAEHPMFWDLFGYRNIPSGVILDNFRWGFAWRNLKNMKRRLPTFKTNLLVQAKRSEFITRPSKELKDMGITSAYWRFEITPHQQVLLEKVSRRLRNRALIVYAAPTFHKLDDLYKYTESEKIFENSSFVKIDRMVNHKKWNYTAPGSRGIAHSVPEFIEDEPFNVMVEKAITVSDNLEFSEHMKILYQTVIEVCKELENDNSLARYYLKRLTKIVSSQNNEDDSDITHYLGFYLFCRICNLQWLPI